LAPTPATTEAFLEVLGEIAHGAGTSEDLTDRLRLVVLDYASETPDNRAAMARIAVAEAPDWPECRKNSIGPVLEGAGLRLADIAHALEDLEMPEALARAFPGMGTPDWDAFMRFTVLIYMLFQAEAPEQPNLE
jgi:hypothetical protein